MYWMLETKCSGLAFSTTKISNGTNESADVSPFLVFRSKPKTISKLFIYPDKELHLPKMTLQQFRIQMTLSRGAL